MEQLGFWSYVHDDDDMSMGRIAALAHDIVANYESIKAEKIELFLDRDDLHWGDQWRGRVNDSLSNVAFFIPIISPRYFSSKECRREFQYFVEKTQALGIRELIMPILWIDVPEFKQDDDLTDPIMRDVREIQWEPWTEKRFLDRDTGAYQRAVFELATELVRRSEIVEKADVVAAIQVAESTVADVDTPGLLDRVAALEEAMPRWTETLELLTQEVSRIGEIMDRGAEEMNAGEARGKGFAARLTIARRVSEQMMEPVVAIESLGQKFVDDLQDIDSGVRALIEQSAEGFGDEDDVADVDEAFNSVRALALTTYVGMESVKSMISAAEPIERQSKDMRKPLKVLRRSLTSMAEAQEIASDWTALLDQAGLGDPLEAAALAESWGEGNPEQPNAAGGGVLT